MQLISVHLAKAATPELYRYLFSSFTIHIKQKKKKKQCHLNKIRYLPETRQFAVFLVGILNYGLRSSHAEHLHQILTRHRLGFLPFLVKHVESMGDPESHVYNFLDYFVATQKPPELHVCLAKALCDGYICDAQKYALSNLLFFSTFCNLC